MRMVRWQPVPVLASAVLTTAVLSSGCSPGDPAPSPASIVLVTLDTTRADRLGAYGSAAGLTPHLDALAARGVLFENAISQAAVTPVSHASILTGLAPYEHGLRMLHGHEHNRLADERTTLAESLDAGGFATGAFVSAFPAGSYFGLDQGFEVFDEDFAAGEAAAGPVGETGVVNTGRHQRRADLTTDRAVAWLESMRAEERLPVFLWVHYFDPHDPAVLPPDEYLVDLPPLEDGEEEHLRALYDREVAFMDREIGRLLEAVASLGEATVAVVADHGEGLGDHDWWTHGVLYQEQIRVPMILAGPGLPAGRRVEEIVRTTDLAATLLDLSGVDVVAQKMDGRSLRGALESGERPERRAAYADSLSTITYRFSPSLTDRKDDVLFALVGGGWKYVHHFRRPEESELYDLASDPGERINRYATDRQRARQMWGALEALPLVPVDDPGARPSELDEEAARRLRALGYVN